uniref:Ribosomal protein L18 n=1 Tax=Histiona aroides TaxID=392300 RepID=M4Q9G3_HISAR|nr:ribosomal protein L18 [Histiona aroides]AGH24057.1 ribosomal protein L18 [Histiona aroides]
MNNSLRLCIKKTNRHLYVYVLNNATQIINVSTDCRMLRAALTGINHLNHPEAISYILANLLHNTGVNTVSYVQKYPYHGKVATIISTLKKQGIVIK